MPREMTAQVGALVTKLAQQSEELVKRRGLLTTPLETLEAEQEIAALGREFSDELMELLLVSSIEERQDPADAAPSPLRALPHRGAEKTRAVGRPATTIRLLGGREMRIKTSYRLPVRTKRPGRRRGVGRRGKAGAGCFPHLVALGKDMLRRVFVSGNAGYFHNEQDGESWEGRKRSLDALKRYGFVRMSVTKEHPPRRLWHLTAAGNQLAQDYWCPEADSPPAAEGAVQHG